jgi:murein DD-endopeptidase MepM/ murein hydrolase activator NlpD
MQLIWVSGPVGKIRTLNLNVSRLSAIFIAFAVILITLGALLHFIGFRIALELNPSLLASYVKLSSENEVLGFKNTYIQKYKEIQKQLEQNQKVIGDLQEQNKKLINLAVPKQMQNEKPTLPSSGGPYKPILLDHEKNIDSLLDDSAELLKNVNQHLFEQKKIIDQQISWIMSKPLMLPITGIPLLSGGFGPRIDPFTKTWSAHEGLDFQEPFGSKILAAGSGRVNFSGWDPTFGNSVVIDHGNGYFSRYAHASQLLVRKGEMVQNQQTLGLIGSTGRSTGPHLHFEIIKNGIPVDPKEYLIAFRKN